MKKINKSMLLALAVIIGLSPITTKTKSGLLKSARNTISNLYDSACTTAKKAYKKTKKTLKTPYVQGTIGATVALIVAYAIYKNNMPTPISSTTNINGQTLTGLGNQAKTTIKETVQNGIDNVTQLTNNVRKNIQNHPEILEEPGIGNFENINRTENNLQLADLGINPEDAQKTIEGIINTASELIATANKADTTQKIKNTFNAAVATIPTGETIINELNQYTDATDLKNDNFSNVPVAEGNLQLADLGINPEDVQNVVKNTINTVIGAAQAAKEAYNERVLSPEDLKKEIQRKIKNNGNSN